MRSRHADKFNHDEEAPGYDEDVADETQPIRAGYGAVLDWVVGRAHTEPSSSVLELGSGTGNLSVRLGPCRRLLCIDVSTEMLRIARAKLAGLDQVEFRQTDLLACFDELDERFDVIASTFAVHHLDSQEKSHLFLAVAKALLPGGTAVFGDLMFANDAHRRRFLSRLREADRPDVADAISEEFFWDLERAVDELEELGFSVESERFSELSFGIAARLKPY